MLIFLVVLTLLSWLAVWPFLRDDRHVYVVIAPDVVLASPVMTFDSKGMV